MKLAKALHIRPMMLVIPFGMLGFGPALTLLIVAFSLVLLAGWLGDEVIKRVGFGVDPSAGGEATAGQGGGPTRW